MDCCVQGSICFELIKGIPAAVAVIAVGGIASAIAYRQYKVAAAKLKLDLFEKRYAIFEQTWRIFSAAVTTGTRAENLGLFTPFNNFLPQARFLFGDSVSAYLDVAVKKWARLHGLEHAASPASAAQELYDLRTWFSEQTDHGVKDIFAPYLELREVEMTPDEWKKYDLEYQRMLGRLIANFGTFEASLRSALYVMSTPKAELLPDSFRITDLQVGETLPHTYLCSFHSLTELIDLYNERSSDAQQIDPELGVLRNAFAHGRILSAKQRSISVLTRFGKRHKVSNGVPVMARYELTLDWLDDQVGRVSDACQRALARTAEIKGSSA